MNIMKLIGDFNIKKANSRREDAVVRRINTLLSTESDFAVQEAYKTARTNILFSLSGVQGCKKIVVTSASPHEGKTTTCMNLAIAFAQINAKVLLIDADLRKPRVYRHLSIEKENGLSDLLCGLIEKKDAIKHIEKYNLDCITSGQIPPNPAEILGSKKMQALLEELGEDYDYIFIDTPPVMVVSEAVALATFTNGVIIVVRQNNTIFETVDRAKEGFKIADAKILGYILNDVSTSPYGYGGRYGKYSYRRKYNYGYGYGYGYGYNYGSNGRYGYGYGYKERMRADKEKAKQEDVLGAKKDKKKKVLKNKNK